MADSQAGQQDQRSSGLLLNLSSNNPFRNRAVSPTSAQSPTSPFDDPPPRPLSRNPFLDPAVTGRSSLSNIRSASESMSTDKRPSLTAEEIFGSLTLVDTSSSSGAPPRPDAAKPPAPPSSRRGPPPPYREGAPRDRRGPPPNHRPTRSQEEALRAQRRQEKGDRDGQLDPSRSPQRRHDRRPRRNSDSSILDADKIMTEDERKQRDQRRRERERRHRENKEKKPPARRVDIIDQLDATSIFGTGIFHHDGPFDALNPHRNRQGSRRAPMQAFPEGSLNNTIGGSGPLHARPDHATFMGQQDDEAFKEWAKGKNGMDGSAPRKGETPLFDPLARNILHGDESLGLGTSTFLEGTPAAKTAIQKREEERAAQAMNEGLQRKKSLAHRIRNINRGDRNFQPSGRLTNPDAYGARRSPSQGGGPVSASAAEGNPFFSEYGSGQGEEGFTVRGTETNRSRASPASPRGGPGLERRSTTDATGGDEVPPKASGILGRMKSLKGRRQRPGPAQVDPDAGPAPGTAV